MERKRKGREREEREKGREEERKRGRGCERESKRPLRSNTAGIFVMTSQGSVVGCYDT
jgi:hypothetical protein